MIGNSPDFGASRWHRRKCSQPAESMRFNAIFFPAFLAFWDMDQLFKAAQCPLVRLCLVCRLAEMQDSTRLYCNALRTCEHLDY